MHRIGIAGFLHESNSFLSVPTTIEHFRSTSYSVGSEILDRWSGRRHELGGMLEGARANGWDIQPLLATFAVPSGTLDAPCYEQIAVEVLHRLEEAMPLDGLLIALHG